MSIMVHQEIVGANPWGDLVGLTVASIAVVPAGEYSDGQVYGYSDKI
jgi:hypothetical protein